MIKEVLFDFDGTIADTVDSVIRYLRDEEIDYDIPAITDELVDRIRNMPPKEIMKEIGLSKLQLIGFIRDYQNYLLTDILHLKVVEGMEDVLDKLSEDYTLGILSSNSESVIRAFLLHYDMEHFEYVEAGAKLWGKERKLKKVAKQRKLEPNQIVYVGDEVKDAEAALKVGMQMISVSWGYNSAEMLEEHNPGGVALEPSDILSLVDGFTHP